jgi:hypothetical protein
MNEAAAAPASREEAGADRIAVALELLPLGAVMMPFLMGLTARWEEPAIDTMLLRAATVAMLSGFGWMKLRRPLRGLAFLVGRGGLLTLLMWWAYASVSAEVAVRQCDTVCDAQNPLVPSIVPIVALVAAFLVTTVASAAAVARTSRTCD